MSHIVPSLSFVRNLSAGLEQGLSVLESFEQSILRDDNEFCLKMSLWWSYEKNGVHNQVRFKTHYQKHLVEIICSGLSGAPIYDHLCHLESEMSREFDRQWKAYLESLPLKLSIPLLIFFFPSYIVLLFGPLVVQFLKELQ